MHNSRLVHVHGFHCVPCWAISIEPADMLPANLWALRSDTPAAVLPHLLLYCLQELEHNKQQLASEEASSRALQPDLGTAHQQVAGLKQQMEPAAAQAQQEQLAAKQEAQ